MRSSYHPCTEFESESESESEIDAGGFCVGWRNDKKKTYAKM